MNRKKNESDQMRIPSDCSSHDLAGLFEWMSSLCKVECRNRSFLGVHLAWKRFWSEVARSMSRSAEAFNWAPVCVTENRPLKSRPLLYSIGCIHRYSRSRFGRDKDVPIIRISGLWLEDYGFHMHRKFKIYPEKNQLVLRLINVVDPSGLPESFPSCDLSSVSEKTVIENV